MTERNNQRRILRQMRRSLDSRERTHRSEQLCRNIVNQRLFLSSRRIALYLAADGEVETDTLIERAWSSSKQVYLPVLVPFSHNRLWFVQYRPDTRLVRNQFGIAEPVADHRRLVAPYTLDAVFTPLVGFDPKGNRLGMGGGFYDRSFAFLRYRKHWKKPRLVGMAFDFQQLQDLPAQPWDVPLSAVATDKQWFDFDAADVHSRKKELD
jgi:5-formyltetrahydrofolate cyclo-ligase